MDGNEDVLEIIREHFPERKIEQLPGSYKIRLPQPVNKMPRYEQLRKALRDSRAPKPVCPRCGRRNTKFRYFDNNSSVVLQARYRCNDCPGDFLFTLGGTQYNKEQSLVNLAIGEPSVTTRPKRGREDLQSLVSETKRTRWQDFARPTAFPSMRRSDYGYGYHDNPRPSLTREFGYHEEHRQTMRDFPQREQRLSLFDYNTNPLSAFPRQPPPYGTLPLFSSENVNFNPFSFRQNMLRPHFTLPASSSSSALSMPDSRLYGQGGIAVSHDRVEGDVNFGRRDIFGYSDFPNQSAMNYPTLRNQRSMDYPSNTRQRAMDNPVCTDYRQRGMDYPGFTSQFEREGASQYPEMRSHVDREREMNYVGSAASYHDMYDEELMALTSSPKDLSTDIFALLEKEMKKK